jgi:tetratricopeptide (TPR) repeat protein
MERLHSIINSLKSAEIKLIRAFFRSQSLKGDLNQREKLFTLILAKPNCSEKEAIQNIFARKNSSGFKQIKKRLKTDILNLLLLQEAEIKYKSKYAQEVFNCRRFIIQGEMLLGRGVYDEAVDVLLKAADLARKNELYAEQIMINDIYRSHIVMKQQRDELGDIKKQIDTSILLLEKSSKAKHLHYELSAPAVYKSSVQHPKPTGNYFPIEQMKADFESTGSLRIGFYYHLSAMQFNSMNRDYEIALFHGGELLELVKSAPAFQSDSFVAGANMQMANALINLERYAEATRYAQIALGKFKSGMINELLALEKLFYCYIRTNEFGKAGEIIIKAFANSKFNYNEFMNGKWWFFKASLEFLKKDYNKAIASLKNCDALLRDKSGWLLGYWLLEMMCRIEKGNLDWFELRSESFKKIIQRHANGSNEKTNKRIVAIFRILRSYRKYDFDFSVVAEIEKNSLELLSKGSGDYYWDPSGFEIFRFEKWLTEKTEEKSEKKALLRK